MMEQREKQHPAVGNRTECNRSSRWDTGMGREREIHQPMFKEKATQPLRQGTSYT